MRLVTEPPCATVCMTLNTPGYRLTACGAPADQEPGARQISRTERRKSSTGDHIRKSMNPTKEYTGRRERHETDRQPYDI